jgi:single-strand DNA-binding protein
MLNVAAIVGRLTAEPELKHTASNVSVVSFTLAVGRAYAKAGTERQTDFIDVVAWRNTAEFICRYFRKGQLMAVQGSIQTRTYQDKNGNNRKAVEIVADNVHFVESKRDSDGQSNYQGGQSYGGNNYSQNNYNNKPAAFNDPVDAYSSGSIGDFDEIPGDDDLPF